MTPKRAAEDTTNGKATAENKSSTDGKGTTDNKNTADSKSTTNTENTAPAPKKPKTLSGGKKAISFTLTNGKKTKEAFLLQISQEDVDTNTLQYLRDQMTKSPEHKKLAQLNFCSKAGSVVESTWLIADYLTAVGSTSEIYLLQKVFEEDNKVDIPNVDPKLLQDPKYLDPKLGDKPKSTFDRAAHQASKGRGTATLPVNLSEKEWAVVVQHNSLLYGLKPIRRKDGNKTYITGLTRARFPAFQIKSRQVQPSEAAAKDVTNVEIRQRIPDFMVDDQSYVAVFETKDELQQSLADSSVSEWDVKASGGGNIFGAGVGVSAGYSQSNSSQHAQSRSTSTSKMNISYHFPRVTLLLDEHSLELTESCKTLVKALDNDDSLKEFLELYGEYFSTTIQLGGRLYASEEFETSQSVKASDVKKSLSARAAVSVTYGVYSAKVEGGYAQSTGNTSDNKDSHFASTMQWQANGGDTLLCNNPPEWVPTVAEHENWRITQRADNKHIIDVISNFKEHQSLSKYVSDWKAVHLTPDKSETSKPGGLKPPPEPDYEPQLFYLRGSTKVYDQYYYLQVWQQSVGTSWSTDRQWLEKTPDPNWKKYEKPIASSGAAALYKTVDDNNLRGLYFYAETEDGRPVQKVHYNTLYRLRNPSTGLYIVNRKNRVVAASKHGSDTSLLTFQSYTNTKRGPIKQGDGVNLIFSEDPEGKKGPNPAYNLGWKDGYHLGVINSTSIVEAAPLEFLDKAEWDKK